MELDQRHFLFASLLAAASCGAAPAVAQEAPAAENKAARESQAELPAQHIVGRRQLGQYNAGSSAGATKTDTPLIEVPQAVRVMTRQLVDDLSAQRLDDVLDYAAGVSRQNNFGGTWDNVAIRGFAGHEDSTMSMLRNGMPANRGFNAPRDTANLEQIEFLKGTMGALYGSSEPGGTLNLVTKQPRFSSGHSVEAYVGSHNYKRMALDSTGPLNGGDGAAPTLAYRLNASVEDKDSFRDDDRERLFALLEPFPHVLVLSAHSHAQRHVFHGAAAGWHGAAPLHEYNVGATCGSYWSGAKDAYGLPDAMMADGTPNGYAVLTVEAGGAYALEWRNARDTADTQIGLHAPKALRRGAYPAWGVYANVYMGMDDSRVEYRIDGGEWMPMKKVLQPDPALLVENMRDDAADALRGYDRSPEAEPSQHLWRGALPTKLDAGEHRVEVRAFDRWRGELRASTTYRLEEAKP